MLRLTRLATLAATVLCCLSTQANAGLGPICPRDIDQLPDGFRKSVCKFYEASKTIGSAADPAKQTSENVQALGGFLGITLGETFVSAHEGRHVDLSDCAGKGKAIAREIVGKNPELGALAIAITTLLPTVYVGVQSDAILSCNGNASLYLSALAGNDVGNIEDLKAGMIRSCAAGLDDNGVAMAKNPVFQGALKFTQKSIGKNYTCGK